MDSSQTPKSRIPFVALAALIFFVFGGVGIYYYQVATTRRAVQEKYQKTIQDFYSLTPENADFLKASQEFEALLKTNTNLLAPRDEGLAKIMYADSLSVIDRFKGAETLKSVVVNPKYPNNIHAMAINFIVNDYELDYIDTSRNFAKKNIFTGEKFASLLSESGGDEDLAIRKLSEWSNVLFPNVVASYRIAKWYASHMYENPLMPDAQRADYVRKMNEAISKGDQLFARFGDSMPPQRRGLAYELKARTIHLSGGNKNEAEKFFRLAIEVHQKQPRNVFQIVYRARSHFYFAAFLARNYGVKRATEIRALVEPTYKNLLVPVEPMRRRPRLISFLIAARDSLDPNYPAVDFNRRDIKLFRKIYPEIGAFIDGLDFLEYVKGHPLEAQLRNDLNSP